MITRIVALVALLILVGLSPTSARAADTMEPFSIGASDVDFYVGYEGVGLRRATDRALSGELMLGYGLLDRLSAFIGTNLAGDGLFSKGQAAVYLGLYGTPLDTRHVDFDLILSVRGGGDGFHDFSVTPGFELNFDLDPDMKSWGAYIKGGVALQGVPGEETDPTLEPTYEFTYDLIGIFGTYYTIASRHQILLELDATIRPKPIADARRYELGGLALGYNVTLSDRIELINQFYFDLPQPGEKLAVGFMTGFIVTLPTVHKQTAVAKCTHPSHRPMAPHKRVRRSPRSLTVKDKE